MKRECFTPSKHSRVCAEHFTKDGFEQNHVVRSLLEPSFKLCQLVLKKDVVPTVFNFTMEGCKPAVGQKTKKNKWIMPAEQRANSSAISQVKKDVYLDPKPSWRRNAAILKTTMTSQSRVSVPFLLLKCAVILEMFSWSHRLSSYF